MADGYDAWFESEKGKRLFDIELESLRSLVEGISHPRLEVGVGTGRFAYALQIDEGLDLSSAVLAYATKRGINVKRGAAECLPYPDKAFALVLMVVTICFLKDPELALRECRRVLKDDGALVIGFVPRDSAWGASYMEKKENSHPFYADAVFYTSDEILAMTERAGFVFDSAKTCLFEPPGKNVPAFVPARDGLIEGAGFAALRFYCR